MNEYDRLKVADLNWFKSPAKDGGAALVLKFKRPIEIDSDSIAIPLEKDHVKRLFKLVTAQICEERLEVSESLIIRPGELQDRLFRLAFGQPKPK